MADNSEIPVRPTQPADIPALTAMINRIIAIGGTTAYETPFSEADLVTKLLDDTRLVCCHTAFDPVQGTPAGYQVLKTHPELPEGWGDIATFARPEPKLPGVGTALFAATTGFARSHGLIAINATIRGDNAGGLAYYAKMGFIDYAVAKAVPLSDGTPVDRISKRYDVPAGP